MTQHIFTKSITIGAAILLAGASTAYAGNGKDCDHKTKTTAEAPSHSQKTATMTSAPAATDAKVLGADAKMKAKAPKLYTFDEAVELCTSKRASDLQACVDKKTGQAPKT